MPRLLKDVAHVWQSLLNYCDLFVDPTGRAQSYPHECQFRCPRTISLNTLRSYRKSFAEALGVTGVRPALCLWEATQFSDWPYYRVITVVHAPIGIVGHSVKSDPHRVC